MYLYSIYTYILFNKIVFLCNSHNNISLKPLSCNKILSILARGTENCCIWLTNAKCNTKALVQWACDISVNSEMLAYSYCWSLMCFTQSWTHSTYDLSRQTFLDPTVWNVASHSLLSDRVQRRLTACKSSVFTALAWFHSALHSHIKCIL